MAGNTPADDGHALERARLGRFLGRVQAFADDMREQGIHVGMGRSVRCVTCGEAWPCSTERRNQSEAG